MRVIEHIPPEPVTVVEGESYIFTQGPIRGADDWQSLVPRKVEDTRPDIDDTVHILIPRRPEGAADWDNPEIHDELYLEQVYWEQDGLAASISIEEGVHLAWHAPQNHELDYPEGREYAKTSWKELWMTIGVITLMKQGRLALGVHPDYEARDKILKDRYLTTTRDRFGIPVFETLDDTVEQALALLGY